MKRNKKRVLAGMRATGRLHLGNYLGSAVGMLELQNNPECETFYMVADVHAIATPYDPSELKQKRREVIVDYLAAGLDPKKSPIFIQSMVPAQLELQAYLSSAVSVARMLHLPTYKDKVREHPKHVTMALLNYPVLMAADILAYKTELVPVGIDQEPHIEIARQIALAMNGKYGTDFPKPVRFATRGGYVPSLLGEGKMSKSVEGSYINLADDLDVIREKLARVPTDEGKGQVVPKEGFVANLLTFVELVMGEGARKSYEDDYVASGVRYKDLKDKLAEAMYKMLEPIQQKRAELAADASYVDDVIVDGAKRASLVAEQTVREVREKMGF